MRDHVRTVQTIAPQCCVLYRDAMSQNEAVHRTHAVLSPEQVELLRQHGMPPAEPHRSTQLRRQAKQGRPFPVISRSGRTYKDPDGRPYGEVDQRQQEQADAGYWKVGAAVRAALEPMTIAVGGTVKRIREVTAWTYHADSGKWVATFGQTFDTPEDNPRIDALYPDYPYRIGDDCPTRRGAAYRPETY